MDSSFASIRYANCLLKPLHGNDDAEGLGNKNWILRFAQNDDKTHALQANIHAPSRVLFFTRSVKASPPNHY